VTYISIRKKQNTKHNDTTATLPWHKHSP